VPLLGTVAVLPFEGPGHRVAYVRGLELGQRNPTIVTLWHIAKALGVKLRLFFDEEKPRRRIR
jgi:transcriptional regulator with XRE-family HTH domain